MSQCVNQPEMSSGFPTLASDVAVPVESAIGRFKERGVAGWALADVDDRQERHGGRGTDLAGSGARWVRDIGQALQAMVHGGLAVVDSGAFVVGERDGSDHSLQVGPCFQEPQVARLGLGRQRLANSAAFAD